MKHSVIFFTGIAALFLTLATISSFLSFDLIVGPGIWSLGSINLLLIAMAFRGYRSVTARGEAAEASTGYVSSEVLSRVALTFNALAILAFVFAAIALLTPDPFLGKEASAWFLGSINLALFGIVISGSSEE